MVSPITALVRAAWLQISADSCAVEPADSHATVSESYKRNHLTSRLSHSPVSGLLRKPLIRQFSAQLSDTAVSESAAPGR